MGTFSSHKIFVNLQGLSTQKWNPGGFAGPKTSSPHPIIPCWEKICLLRLAVWAQQLLHVEGGPLKSFDALLRNTAKCRN